MAKPLALKCQWCDAWSVSGVDHEVWTSPSGKSVDLLVGWCDRCDSQMLSRPSPGAVAKAKAQIAAMREAKASAAAAMKKVARNG